MTTSRANTASDGEAVEMQHKAKRLNQRNAFEVNGSNRVFGLDGVSDNHGSRYRSLSRSPSPYRRRDSRSPSPYRSKRVADRSRSPSPYRNKRTSDHSRSPSPFRHGRESGGSRSYPKRKGSPPRAGRPEKRPHTDSSAKPISYAELGNPNAVPDFRDGMSANGRSQNLSNGGHQRNSHQARSRRHEQVTTGVAQGAAKQSSEQQDVEMKSVADETDYTLISVEEKVPTEESREEKRRRWAAKRAKADHDLLHQAVITNASEATTKNAASPSLHADTSMSPYASPRNGDFDSAPASPDVMVIDKQAGVSEANSPAAASPSAADYDPTQDMLDDRDRAANKNRTSEVSSGAYHETDPKVLSTLPAEKAVPAKKQKKKELDMFASDDEDDDDAEAMIEETTDTKGTVLHEKLLDNWDDPEGYYKLISNELVNNGRYRMIRFLGRGVFANVAQAEDRDAENDHPSRKVVAIKMIRRNELMRKASQKEMDFLRRVNDEDPQDRKHIVRLLGSFDHKGHLCLVFEHMSKNLRDLLKQETNGHGLTFSAVRIYAKQMFSGLQHLQNCQIIHLDLKPDNVLVSEDKKTIKLADFGTAVDKRDIIERTEYIVSRFYRAPEIILGMDISYPVDMWAVGCTVYELWTGTILFTGSSNNQMVKAFMDILGWPSEKLLRKGLANNILTHFEFGSSSLKFISRELDKQEKSVIRKIEQRKKIDRDLKTRVHEAAEDIASGGPTATELNDLADLLSACLNMNVEKRLTPKEAINHKVFGASKPLKPLVPKSAVVKPPMMRRGAAGLRR